MAIGAGSEDGRRGPTAKEREWPLKSMSGTETDAPGAPARGAAGRHLDSRPLRPVSGSHRQTYVCGTLLKHQ